MQQSFQTTIANTMKQSFTNNYSIGLIPIMQLKYDTQITDTNNDNLCNADATINAQTNIQNNLKRTLRLRRVIIIQKIILSIPHTYSQTQ